MGLRCGRRYIEVVLPRVTIIVVAEKRDELLYYDGLSRSSGNDRSRDDVAEESNERLLNQLKASKSKAHCPLYQIFKKGNCALLEFGFFKYF